MYVLYSLKPSALHLLLHVLHIQIHSLLIHLHRSVSRFPAAAAAAAQRHTCSNAAWKAPNACGVPDFTITRRFLRQRVTRSKRRGQCSRHASKGRQGRTPDDHVELVPRFLVDVRRPQHGVEAGELGARDDARHAQTSTDPRGDNLRCDALQRDRVEASHAHLRDAVFRAVCMAAAAAAASCSEGNAALKQSDTGYRRRREDPTAQHAHISHEGGREVGGFKEGGCVGTLAPRRSSRGVAAFAAQLRFRFGLVSLAACR